MAKFQEAAIEIYVKEFGLSNQDTIVNCTADIDTCPNDECMICGIRDCPHREPLHYHHDGCPACYSIDFVSRENDRPKV